MYNIADALRVLEDVFVRVWRLEQEQKDNLNSPLPPALRDEQDAQIKSHIDQLNGYKVQILDDLVNFPPQHLRHAGQIMQFHQRVGFEQSVFIMTKYPEGNTPLDLELRNVIQAVKDALIECSLVPQVARENRYHANLWDNVELHLLACKRGVAIIESKYKEELNPNVAMEWGWMRAMNRDVLYLAENDFDLGRADWGGLIQDRFSWADPRPGIRAAVRSWLGLDHSQPADARGPMSREAVSPGG